MSLLIRSSSARQIGRNLLAWRHPSRPMSVQKPLKELNDLFLQSYGARKASMKETLGKTRPVILLHSDNLILKHNGTTKRITYVPERYHMLKSIAHTACIIHTLQELKEKKLIGQAEVEGMEKKCISNITKVLEILESKHPEPELVHYKALLNTYLSLMQGKQTKAPPLHCLKASLEQLLKEAAILRTEALHEQVKIIRTQMCPSQWNTLAVIVMGPRMPREGDLAVQYSQKMILGSQDSLSKLCPHLNGTAPVLENKKLVYLESINDEDKALDELSTEICDELMGEAILGEKERMRGDFLRDSVREHLQSLQP